MNQQYTERVPYSLKFFAIPIKTGELSIFGRIGLKRQKSEIATGIRCLPEEWDDEAKTFNAQNSHSGYLLTRMREFEGKVYAGFVSIRNAGQKPTSAMMKEVITGKSEAGSPRLLQYVDDYLILMRKKGEHSEGTMAMYRKTRGYILAFLKSKKIQNLRLNQFRISHVVDFQDYMLSTVNKQLKRPVSRTTSNKNMKNLKSIIRHALSRELIDRDPFAGFQMKWDKVTMAFLTQQEVRMITDHDLNGDEHLRLVRQCFLFSVHTGLRYSDSFNLLRRNIIVEDDGQHWLTINQKKTRTALSVPLFKPAAKILKYFEDLYPEMETVLPFYTNQYLNRSLADICKIAGIIDKRVTWHTARHTYACSLIEKDVDLLTTSYFLGHSSTKSSEIYAKVTRSRAKKIAMVMAGI